MINTHQTSLRDGSLLGYRWALSALNHRGSYDQLARIGEWSGSKEFILGEEDDLPHAIESLIGHGLEFESFCENVGVTPEVFSSPEFAAGFLDSALTAWQNLDGYTPPTSDAEVATSANPEDPNLVWTTFLKPDGSYETTDRDSRLL